MEFRGRGPDNKKPGAPMGGETSGEGRAEQLPTAPTSVGHPELRYGALEKPVPSRWLKVPVVEERVREWEPDNFPEVERTISAEGLPDFPLWSALTPQGPILVFAEEAWGDRFEAGPVKLFRLMKGKVRDRPDWVHLLQISVLDDWRWATWEMAGWMGDVYVMLSQPESR